MLIVFLLNVVYSITSSHFLLYHEEGTKKKLSYLEAFLVDSLLIGRKVNLDYIMLNHMIACCESMTRLLPYERF